MSPEHASLHRFGRCLQVVDERPEEEEVEVGEWKCAETSTAPARGVTHAALVRPCKTFGGSIHREVEQTCFAYPICTTIVPV